MEQSFELWSSVHVTFSRTMPWSRILPHSSDAEVAALSTTPTPYPCWRRTSQRGSRSATKGRQESTAGRNSMLRKRQDRRWSRKCPGRASRSAKRESAGWNWNWAPILTDNYRPATLRKVGNSRPSWRVHSGRWVERPRLVISTATKFNHQYISSITSVTNWTKKRKRSNALLFSWRSTAVGGKRRWDCLDRRWQTAGSSRVPAARIIAWFSGLRWWRPAQWDATAESFH